MKKKKSLAHAVSEIYSKKPTQALFIDLETLEMPKNLHSVSNGPGIMNLPKFQVFHFSTVSR